MPDPISPSVLLHEFHTRPGCDVGPATAPTLDFPGADRRVAYFKEEVREFLEAVEAGNLPGALKEAADVIYALYGFAWRGAWPLDAVLDEVHGSNMTKTPAPGDGKAIKGEGYVPADVERVLAEVA